MSSSLNSSISEILDIILDKGEVISNNPSTDICCPGCQPYETYVISSVETFLKFGEATGGDPCCVRIRASVETYLKFNEAGFLSSPPDCNPNFDECLDELLSSSTGEEIDRILDKGVVEYNTLSGDTEICRLGEFFNIAEYYSNFDGGSSSTKAEIIDRILDKGIVIGCSGSEIIIASVETYLKWAEAVG
jgi:hypothetical protein